MKDVGDHTRVKPEPRQRSLFKFLEQIKANEEATKILANWGLEIAPKTVALKGRVLPPDVSVVAT